MNIVAGRNFLKNKTLGQIAKQAAFNIGQQMNILRVANCSLISSWDPPLSRSRSSRLVGFWGSDDTRWCSLSWITVSRTAGNVCPPVDCINHYKTAESKLDIFQGWHIMGTRYTGKVEVHTSIGPWTKVVNFSHTLTMLFRGFSPTAGAKRSCGSIGFNEGDFRPWLSSSWSKSSMPLLIICLNCFKSSVLDIWVAMVFDSRMSFLVGKLSWEIFCGKSSELGLSSNTIWHTIRKEMRNLVVRTDYKVFIIFRVSAAAQGVDFRRSKVHGHCLL